MISLALTHTPREVQFYCLDFGGGALSGLRDLPHVGAVATRLDVGQVRRTIAELTLLLVRARAAVRRPGHRLASPRYRRRRAAGEFADDPFGDVFLVIDGWATVRSEFEDLEPQLTELVNRGLSFGVHVVVSAEPVDGPAAGGARRVRHQAGAAARRPVRLDARPAGRAQRAGEHARAGASRPRSCSSSPRCRGSTAATRSTTSSGRADRRWSVTSRAAWDRTRRTAGSPAARRRCRTTACRWPRDRPRSADRHRRGRPAPVWLDFATDPHALVFGDTECGKSTFLRTLRTVHCRPVRARRRPGSSWSTTGAACSARSTTEHLIGYGTSAQVTDGLITEVVERHAQPAARPRRHPRTAARPQLVEGARPVRAGRRLRPGRRGGEQPVESAAGVPRPGP